MSWKKTQQRLESYGLVLADRVSAFVGTWTFVFLYTSSMIIWIGLHLAGVLHIDSAEFMKWNLWLSYFAGTQASLVLMSSSRQALKDRERQEHGLTVDQATLAKVEQLYKHIEMIEGVLEEFIQEQVTNATKDES